MNLGIISASGKLGSILMSKMENNRATQTTAIVRDKKKVKDAKNVLEKDIFSLTINDIENFDYIICAYGPPAEKPEELVKVTKHLIQLFENQTTKLLICGGVGPLYLNPEKTVRVSESDDVPADFVKLAKAEAEAFDLLKQQHSFNWLYFAPPFELSLDYQVNHDYVLADDVLRFSSNGTSILSYGDFSDAILEALSDKYMVDNRIVSVSEQ